MKKIALLGALVFTLVFSASAFAAEELTNGFKTIATDSSSAVKVNSHMKGFKSKFSDLIKQLEVLRTESKDVQSEIKTETQNIKAQWRICKDALKGDKKTDGQNVLKDLRAKVEPLRDQIKTIHSEIKNLSAQKASKWDDFKSAVKVKDETKASTALNNIINHKKQVIEKEKAVLNLKQQILDLLKS